MKKESLEKSIEKVGKELPFKDSTELGEVFTNLDDEQNADVNARLSKFEVKGCMRFDELQQWGILPPDAKITTQIKRLSVSVDGKGRTEKVAISSATRGAELSGRSGGILGWIGDKFKRNEG